MKILGLKDGNITILDRSEIQNKATDLYNYLNKDDLPQYKKESLFETYNGAINQREPYNLFKFNELNSFILNYIGVEITEEQYYERLECLPPMPFKYDIYSGYIVPECITVDIYEHIFKHDDKYYCVIMSAERIGSLRNWF